MESPVQSTEPVIPGPEFQEPESLIPCSLCNRKFVPESLVRHRKACEKLLMKKRKQFDSAKQRLTGELAECLPLPMTKVIKRASPIRKSSRWKEKHLQLLETLRAAREGTAAPALSKPADHEQCPHCGRSFGPKAFDRHVEYCKEKFSRLENVKPNISLQAKERLEARTKYRAPCVKSKRSITREKYLPPHKREPSPTGNNVTSPVGNKPTEIKRSKFSNN
uniref:Zinc finger C2HC domain-containing protein 1A n=1 Tax=Cacopsylla melanoneura TaxID=428564 RepID=A0A8D8XCK1_9HEMI